jgi:hypothetical protein
MKMKEHSINKELYFDVGSVYKEYESKDFKMWGPFNSTNNSKLYSYSIYRKENVNQKIPNATIFLGDSILPPNWQLGTGANITIATSLYLSQKIMRK